MVVQMPSENSRAPLVLVAEDDEDLSVLVQMMLEHAGFEVVTAANGREALDRVQQRMPDVILLDMKMPVMNGWEFSSQFHERFNRGAKVVVMSAADHAPYRAQEIGADGWLSKPFSAAELLKAVRN
jgi:CheY-like chemotaxis protein